ncbi:molecular chaperone TorD family protein [Mesorhizobium sp. LNHC209A00]|uniref:TorD/DmsD family molecular chaperone n=1 Tax=Mesorhizobium TaxID=68287 RepID=UPI0003D05D8D|nr:molecular chaperone TorD family protein [Mesorhizobium sp. LNHC209A00]ESY94359.1 molecular chaperone TorD [Mesorhizobium sp. LNHC209A00]
MQDSPSRYALGRTVDETDQARAEEYALLARLLSSTPDAEMMRRLALLRGDLTPLGLAHAALGEAASRVNEAIVGQEYSDLFGGLGPSGLLPYSSHYLSGSLYGRPLAPLRETLRHLGIERADRISEPEDHAAILCEVMAGLAGGEIVAPIGAERQFFEEFLAPWIGRFFVDLEQAASANFYARVGAVGRTFVEIEREALLLCSV